MAACLRYHVRRVARLGLVMQMDRTVALRSPRMRTIYGALLVVILAAGCNGQRIVKVSGVATRAGKPVPDMQVTFVPSEGRPSRGVTDDQGRFAFGALTGTHKIWVQLRPVSPKDDQELVRRIETLQQDPEIEQILQKYGADTSSLRANVTQDGQVIDLELD